MIDFHFNIFVIGQCQKLQEVVPVVQLSVKMTMIVTTADGLGDAVPMVSASKQGPPSGYCYY